jgi:hypothetical protein
MRHHVIEVQALALRAASALVIHEGALPLVAPEDLPLDRPGDVATPGIGHPARLAPGNSELALLELGDQQLHCILDQRLDGGAVAGKLLGPLEVVLERLAGSELNVEASRRQRLDFRGLGGLNSSREELLR